MSKRLTHNYSIKSDEERPKSDLEILVKGEPPLIAKTKIVCTLGPASRDVPMLEKLLKAGKPPLISSPVTSSVFLSQLCTSW